VTPPRASMARTPRRNRPFSKPIVLRDGKTLASLAEAAAFLNTLRREEITAPLYYAGALLSKAIEGARAGDAEMARLELIRAFRAEGWL